MEKSLKENELRKKLVRFVEACTPPQLKMLDDSVKSLVKSGRFSTFDEPVRHTATGRAGHDQADLEEGNSGTLYRSPN